MKKTIICLCILLLLLPLAIRASAVSVKDIIAEQMQTQDMEKLDGLARQDDKLVLPNFTFSDAAKSFAAGTTPFETSNLLSAIPRSFLREVYVNLFLMLKLIAIALLFSLLNNLKAGFDKKSVGDAAYLVCYMLMAGVLFQAFLQAANLTKEAVSQAAAFVTGIVPLLITLMISSGAITTAAAFDPVLLICTQVVTNMTQYFFIPLFYVIAALSLVDNLNEKFPVTKLSDLLKKTVKWSLGFVMTLFVGIMSVHGFATSVLDGVTGKAAKYVVGSFVPVVGSILSDTVDTMAGCILVVKSAAGAAGIAAVAVICLTPILKLAAMSFVFYITAAVVEPVADKRITQAISAVGSVTGMMVAVVSAVALMFIICISMVIGMGNNAAMLR